MGWGLHIWGDVEHPTPWSSAKQPTGSGPEGPYWDVVLQTSAKHVGLLIHKGEEKAAGAEHVDPSKAGEVWLVQNEQHPFFEVPDMSHIPAGTLFKSYAHWVKASSLVWRVPVSEDGELSSPQRLFQLHFSRDSRMHVTGKGIEGADEVIPLRIAGLNIPADVMAKYPHLFGSTHLEIDPQNMHKVREYCKGQVALSVQSHTGRVLDCTGVQLAGMLDDLFATDEPLGDHIGRDTKSRAVSVWAPTAKKVELLHFWELRGGQPEVLPMACSERGVWSCARPAEWQNTLGLRVVLDVVYNHTFASGPYSQNSVLDKIVPGYYHRRQEDGEIYDPVHYGVPEGSYSTAPDGPLRVLEFREMVQSLHSLGLRVVLDVVYNHTFASGPYSQNSVLDKIVPGYYHRRQEDGEMCHSTCCNNTASEHRMFERLMVEDLVHWARDYKVDGFRFDIMGHHFVGNMTAIRNAINGLTLERDGVDGRKMYIYGEAWDFGEVALNQRGRNASQHNLGGSRIGAFNDRMRDGAMGGSPYQSPDCQGFATGLAVDPNGAQHQGSAKEQLATLLHRTDWVRFALAGNLKDYEAQVADGRLVAGQHETYHGNQPLAYGCDPAENVVFNGCHDNETIFDQVMMKLGRHVDADGRARVCGLAHALLVLSQGVPFIHAGDDLLRSKSLDRDSYNSGDWFNRIDWTGQHNNFGIGLPPASKNQQAWEFKRPLLTAADRYRPSPAIIARQAAYFKALLRVRYSSPLFRMPTGEHIRQQLRFHNTGPQQVPGVIVMQLHSSWQPDHGSWDPQYKQALVVFNARPEPYEAEFPEGAEWYKLHPALAALQEDAMVQLCSADNEKRRLHVSPRMAAVFVQPRS
uniref:pullulanase n=1 Tax=Tetradesmus obliquus TaxID=3088 RepID=A0A383WMX3_TETOB|eukprot:jgi/Sobl393_1/15961/SZX78788.1